MQHMEKMYGSTLFFLYHVFQPASEEFCFAQLLFLGQRLMRNVHADSQ